jgi:tetratricopeptide (TPR) repeat protein
MNEIIRRCLRKNVAERFTAAELVSALDAQLGRAKTAPYTNANAVTAATPTLIRGSQLKTVQEAASRRRGAWMAEIPLIAIVVAMAAVGGWYWLSHRAKPVTSVAAPKALPPVSQPASTTSVNVIAPPQVIEERKPDVAPTATHELPPSKPVTTTTEDAAPISAEPQHANEQIADALYATAMSELLGGDAQQARETLHRVLKQDPHYAKAHYRMGEIALLNRNMIPATEELNLALADADRLDAREQQLVRIGLALTEHNRREIQRLAEEIWQQWPDDPDLARMRATFPGMFLELPRDRGRRRRPQA